MPERIPHRMPDRMSEYMPDRLLDCMPDRVPNRMSEYMSDRMPECMPDKCQVDFKLECQNIFQMEARGCREESNLQALAIIKLQFMGRS